LAISNAPSMVSAINATLNLAALLLISIEIFIIFYFFRIDSLRSVWLGVKQVRLPDGYPFVCHVAIFRSDTELSSENADKAKFAELEVWEVRCTRPATIRELIRA
jgi:hypothetical protein